MPFKRLIGVLMIAAAAVFFVYGTGSGNASGMVTATAGLVGVLGVLLALFGKK